MSILQQRLQTLLAGREVEIIAQNLLGSHITTSFDGKYTTGLIVETEAYKAPEDKGSHAYGNKRTQRTETLFHHPGTSYVYLCYGIHHLFNIVSGPRGSAHAILLRAIEPIDGIGSMLDRRKANKITKNLTNGPGKLSQALGISTNHNGVNLYNKQSKIKIKLAEQYLSKDQIICSPRVGISYAQECAQWPWRFRIKDNPWTSLPHECTYHHDS